MKKNFDELSELEQLKIRKVFMYSQLDRDRVNEAVIVFTENDMAYLIFDNEMYDL